MKINRKCIGKTNGAKLRNFDREKRSFCSKIFLFFIKKNNKKSIDPEGS